MIQRRAADLGFRKKIGCRTVRATGISAYLETGGTPENAHVVAAHESSRTMELYDRRNTEMENDRMQQSATLVRSAKRAFVAALLALPILLISGFITMDARYHYQAGQLEAGGAPPNMVPPTLPAARQTTPPDELPIIGPVTGGQEDTKTLPDPSSGDDGKVVTLKLTKGQARKLLMILEEALGDEELDPKPLPGSPSPANAQPTPEVPQPSAAPTAPMGQLLAGAQAQRAVVLQDSKPSRLSGAAPLILVFVCSVSLVVVLMIYAGIVLVRAGSSSPSGAKLDILGMKIDAKGGGVASIACGALVLVATFRPLIEALVSLSRD